MARGDRELEESLQSVSAVRCFRYVDDFLVCVASGTGAEGAVQNVLSKFRAAREGLKFTYELPVDNGLQYLDFKLKFEQGHTCCYYHTRGEKQLLPFDSAHSKLVKGGIAKACLTQAIRKPCFLAIAESLDIQTAKFRNSGYPESLIDSVAEKILSVLLVKGGGGALLLGG